MSTICESVTYTDPDYLGVGAIVTVCATCGVTMLPDGDGVVEAVADHCSATADLYDAITHAPTRHIRLGDRWALAEHLLLAGWRR